MKTYYCIPNDIEDEVLNKYKDTKALEKQFFTSDRELVSKRRSIDLIDGEYKLEIRIFSTNEEKDEKCWLYSQGLLFNKQGELLIEICRNYPSFPYTFFYSEPLDNYLLVCGEDYQGYIIYDVKNNAKYIFYPIEAEKGYSLCWADINHNPKGDKLIVHACYWGGPYDIYIYDISDIKLPLKLLKCIRDVPDYTYIRVTDTYIEGEEELEYRVSDGKLYKDLSDEEQIVQDTALDEEVDWKSVPFKIPYV